MPSEILLAVYRNRQEELGALLAKEPALTICEAAAVGDAARVAALVDADRVRLQERSDDGTAVPVVAQLLARGAEANAAQNGGFTALHEAAFKNDLQLAELLLAHGADPARRTNDGETAEAIATRLGHTQLARRLRGELP
jgi:ankyrin repeat protein